MDEKKQIEEMANEIFEHFNCRVREEEAERIAEHLVVNANYRKQSVGEWKFEHDALNDPKGYFVRIVCSCCGLKTGQVSNFCPQCGAKMKGGAE